MLRPLVVVPVVAFALTMAMAAAALPSAASDVPSIVQRFLDSGEPPLTQYQAVRRLEARNERFKLDGWLEACTDLSADGVFQYGVIEEGGSGTIRGRVLKKALESEREAWANGEIARSTIGIGNYEFQPTEENVDGELLKVLIRPLRKSRMLVDGAMFLTAGDGDLVRVEGKLADNPSFWTRRVEVVRRYQRVAGVRVPVEFESFANVRLAGRSSFRMTYRYSSVNGHPIAEGPGQCDKFARLVDGRPSEKR